MKSTMIIVSHVVNDSVTNGFVPAAKAMGLNVCGVDILRSNRGPVVMEVNSSPGLEGVEKATGLDIAGKMIELLEKNHLTGRTRTKGRG